MTIGIIRIKVNYVLHLHNTFEKHIKTTKLKKNLFKNYFAIYSK